MERADGVYTEDDAEALVLGLGMFATGGGGLAARGRALLRSLREEGIEVRWAPLESLDSDALTCSVYGMGSIAPHPRMTADEMAAFGVDGERHPRPWIRAVDRLEAHLGRVIEAIVPFELGPSNTIVAVDAAARTGRTLVDGDYIGRALPKMSQALPAVLGLPTWPLTICDPWGNALVLEDCPSPAVAERIGKMVSRVTKAVDVLASCSHAAFPNPASEIAPALVPGTLSRSLRTGRQVLAARTGGDDPVHAAANAGHGRILGRGVVTRRRWEDSVEGYMEGTTDITGSGEWDGTSFEIWFQNEHHILWENGRVTVTSPDLIAVVDGDSAEPISNAELEEGRRVALLGFPAAEAYRSGAALEVTAPPHYGYPDIAWSPLEND